MFVRFSDTFFAICCLIREKVLPLHLQRHKGPLCMPVSMHDKAIYILYMVWAMCPTHLLTTKDIRPTVSNILSEITPISERDCFFLAERHKTTFSYPLHKHKEYELNFVFNARDAARVVADSLEAIGDYDMCLLGPGIEHEWQQHNCQSTDIHEIPFSLPTTSSPDP